METLIESHLKQAGEYGLSIKKLKSLTNTSKNRIKTILLNSKFVKDTNPIIHGSLKQKIRVYSYEPFECSYIKRKTMKNNKSTTESISKKQIMEQLKNMSESESDSGSENNFDIDEFELINKTSL